MDWAEIIVSLILGLAISLVLKQIDGLKSAIKERQIEDRQRVSALKSEVANLAQMINDQNMRMLSHEEHSKSAHGKIENSLAYIEREISKRCE